MPVMCLQASRLQVPFGGLLMCSQSAFCQKKKEEIRICSGNSNRFYNPVTPTFTFSLFSRNLNISLARFSKGIHRHRLSSNQNPINRLLSSPIDDEFR